MQPVDAERRLQAWLAETTGRDGITLGPLLAGGNSNVTRLIETRQGRLVLRHPPVAVVSDKAAAGIEREYRVIAALAGRAPVPAAIAWCADPAVIGQPFAVTEWVEGVALTDRLPAGWPETDETVNQLGLTMIEGLARVHAVDWRAVLPADFARPEGFVQRQVERWVKVRAADRVRDLPLLEEIGMWLLANQPAALRASVIHCDFHLDNCLVAPDRPELRVILDWEMATLGDPLVDLGLCLFFWQRDPSARLGFSFVQGLTNRPGVLPARALAERWSAGTGLGHDHIDYFIVFAAWRLAAIVEGAWVLQTQGKVDTPYSRGLEHDVLALLREAAQILEKGKVR